MHNNITITTTHHNELSQDISFTFTIPKKDFLYKDYISFTAAHPLVHITPWKTDTMAIPYYDPLFKGTKEIFKKDTTITVTVAADDFIPEPVQLYYTYYQRSEKKINQCIYALSFTQEESLRETSELLQTNIETNSCAQERDHVFIEVKNTISSPPIPIHATLFFTTLLFCLFLIFLSLRYKKRVRSSQVYEAIIIVLVTASVPLICKSLQLLIINFLEKIC